MPGFNSVAWFGIGTTDPAAARAVLRRRVRLDGLARRHEEHGPRVPDLHDGRPGGIDSSPPRERCPTMRSSPCWSRTSRRRAGRSAGRPVSGSAGERVGPGGARRSAQGQLMDDPLHDVEILGAQCAWRGHLGGDRDRGDAAGAERAQAVAQPAPGHQIPVGRGADVTEGARSRASSWHPRGRDSRCAGRGRCTARRPPCVAPTAWCPRRRAGGCARPGPGPRRRRHSASPRPACAAPSPRSPGTACLPAAAAPRPSRRPRPASG